MKFQILNIFALVVVLFPIGIFANDIFVEPPVEQEDTQLSPECKVRNIDFSYSMYNLLPENMKETGKIVDPEQREYLESIAIYSETFGNIKYSYVYDKNKQIITINSSWVNDNGLGEAYFREVNEYDQAGNRTLHLYQKVDSGKWENLRRNTFTYDKNNNLLRNLFETYDNEWKLHSRTNYEYDSDGYLISIIFQAWRNEQWESGSMYLYTNDQRGNMLSFTYTKWNDFDWIIDYIYTYTYDDNDSILTKIIEYNRDEELLISQKETNSYNSTGKIILYIRESWSDKELWDSVRTVYEYKNDSLLTSEKTDVWREGTWKNSKSQTYTYDSDGRMLTAIYSNWKDDAWTPRNKTSYQFDSEGVIQAIISQYWDSSWVNYKSERYNYSNGNMISNTYQKWEDEEWGNKYRESYSYNSNGNKIQNLYEKWINNQWVVIEMNKLIRAFNNKYYDNCSYKVEQRYLSFNSIPNHSAQTFSTVSPNPFTESTIINYELTKPDFVGIKIYNALGYEVAVLVNSSLESGKHQAVFNAQNLPQGMYYYIIRIGEKAESGKIIIMK